MIDEDLKAAFAQDVVFLHHAGLKPVVVHGGGPQISAALDRHGIVSEFKAGLRVTTEDAMDVVRMVLAGQVQRELVGLLNQHGPLAVGLTGEDAHTITATKHQPEIDGELVDIGRVGEITAIDTGAIEALLADGRIPVVSSIARSQDDGHVYNVNADTAAAALAAALGAETLMVLTDVEGLYEDWPNSDEVISRLTASQLEKLLPELSSGMVPKMEGCLHAVRNGVQHRPRHRRPGPALDPAGDLHRRGHRHDGRAGRGRGGRCMTANEELTQRWQGSLMNNYGTPRLPARPRRGHQGVGRRRQGVPRLRRRYRGQRARPRPPGDRRGRQHARSPPSAMSPTSSSPNRPSPSPNGCSSTSAATARSSSATRAPRPTRAPSRSAG